MEAISALVSFLQRFLFYGTSHYDHTQKTSVEQYKKDQLLNTVGIGAEENLLWKIRKSQTDSSIFHTQSSFWLSALFMGLLFNFGENVLVNVHLLNNNSYPKSNMNSPCYKQETGWCSHWANNDNFSQNWKGSCFHQPKDLATGEFIVCWPFCEI